MPVDGDLDLWRRAARISAEVRELGARLLVPGASRRAVAEAIEESIRARGAQPAFPANLSRNQEAAHYTPSPDDDLRFAEGDLVKVDVGAHLDGRIADTAKTVEVGGSHRYAHLIRAVTEAVQAGISRVHVGVSVEEISAAIEEAIHRRGVKPVANLTGHTIERYLLHAGTSIPNVRGGPARTLAEGEIVAIEPFATNGAGSIENGPYGNILRFRTSPGGVASELAPLFERFRTLPFTTRWIDDPHVTASLRRHRRLLQTYPVFVESGGGWVAQAEHTILVTATGAEVLTALDTPPR